ncbi:hypothetical protein CBS14141_001699 [Malassezia furfur]|nr:hypothetical protein CBS14141_001699 [Malassezia furfur]
MAAQGMPESDEDDEDEEDDDDDEVEDLDEDLDEEDAEDVDEDDVMHPGAIEGGPGGVFFLETEGADGTTIEHHVRHLSLRELQQLLTYGMSSFDADDPASEDSEDDSGRPLDAPLDLWEPVTEPVRAGQELKYSGDFGMTLAAQITRRKQLARAPRKADMAYALLPSSRGVLVADTRKVYDTTMAPRKRPETVRDTSYFGGMDDDAIEQVTSLNLIQTVEAQRGQWTITDVNLSPDNQWIVYSSISPYVGLSPVRHVDDDAGGAANQIWSLRFSGDSREIIAGAHYGYIYVYDIEAQRRVLSVGAHNDDVNSVTFADATSSNVFVSGSDDSMLKVWDRRSLVRGKPAGCLPGHTEGITYIAPKGDGRYCISNSKDQSVRLWDLRNLVSLETVENWAPLDYSLRNWDYRYMPYRRPRYYAHPEDCSVMTYRGHSVLRTLIRCYFSPRATTGQQYIYSGSADGRIHIWSLDGRVVQVIDRNYVHPLQHDDGRASDPFAPEWDLPPARRAQRSHFVPRYGRMRSASQRDKCIVRDVSWHSDEPTLMSTSWDGGDGQAGSVAQHRWRGPTAADPAEM